MARILLAASDARAAAMHRAFLTRQGYDVVVCNDGLACVERLRLDGPDLLALTLDLPWGSGEGIVALIATGELPRVPVVLLADYPCSLRVNPGGWSPVRWLLPWPAPPRLLGKAVRQVLAGNPLGRPSPEIDAPTHDWAAQPLHLA
jgi:DNA-binding NarL/FixJ family response regulator